jgi:hypothetical protein
VAIVQILLLSNMVTLFLLGIALIELVSPRRKLSEKPVPETIRKAYLAAIEFDYCVNGRPADHPRPSGQS